MIYRTALARRILALLPTLSVVDLASTWRIPKLLSLCLGLEITLQLTGVGEMPLAMVLEPSSSELRLLRLASLLPQLLALILPKIMLERKAFR